MNKLSIVLFAFAFVLTVTHFANAQELPKAAKYENVTWYRVGYIKFLLVLRPIIILKIRAHSPSAGEFRVGLFRLYNGG